MGYQTTKNFFEERLKIGERIGLINLGCARNLVDSQAILGQLKRRGHRIVDIQNADVAIVNTCAFVEEAKRESIDTILDLIKLKTQGKLKKIVVAGCLAERYSKELAQEFKEVDAIIGVQKLEKDKIVPQVSLTPKHFAYVKISESCYNHCSFCVIPKIKGKFTSRTIESVLEEIRQLDAKGVKEVHIIGQDITAYGMDLYHEKSLARLLKEMVKITKNIQWIRLLYAFPAHVTDELMDVIAAEEKICKYIDMPLQHISDNLLLSMNRGITTQGTKTLIEKIRTKIPHASLRTTFIAGLPGETERNFHELLNFMKEVRFEKAGVFVYSREEGTPAYQMPGQVPDSIKKQRLDALMQAQQEISKSIQEKFIGRTLKVLIDEKQKGDPNLYLGTSEFQKQNSDSPLLSDESKRGGQDRHKNSDVTPVASFALQSYGARREDSARAQASAYLGRSEYDAPEVDGVVYVKSSQKLKPGDFVSVRIKDSYEYDLEGEALE